jgi:cold shock CspA family protein
MNANQEFEGIIKRWKPESGWGFAVCITPGEKYGANYFIHIQNVVGQLDLAVTDIIRFQLAPGYKTRTVQAVNVRIVKRVSVSIGVRCDR